MIGTGVAEAFAIGAILGLVIGYGVGYLAGKGWHA